MTLPVLSKTWQFTINQEVSATGNVDNTNRTLLYMIKTALIGFAAGAWTVTSSSNGTVANLSDNWTAYTSLVFATGTTAHSWIVLTNAGGAQLCIDCNVASTLTETCQIYFSPGGGYATTGLVTTARPTPPADEVARPGSGFGGHTADWFGRFHAMLSSDGACTRIIVCRSNEPVAIWLIDAVKSPITGWTNPNVFTVYGANNDTTQLTYAVFNDAANLRGFITTSFNLYMTSFAYGAAMIGENIPAASLPDDSYPMSPMGLASTTASHQGRKGALFDLWWGPTGTPPSQTYPKNASYQFAQFSDIIFPWNGTLPRLY